MAKFFTEQPASPVIRVLGVFTVIVALLLLISYLAAYVSPQRFWPLAFFGLTYPVWLGLNLLCLIGWIALRRKWLWVPLIAWLIGFSHFRHFVQFNFRSAPLHENSTRIKVLSYNVRLFDLYNWERNRQTRDAIFKLLQHADPDIICFQEFYHTGRKGYFTTRDTLVKLLRTRYYHEGYTHRLHHQQYFGIATFSAFPIVGTGEISFRNDKNNNAIYSDILVKNDTLRIYNAHLSSVRFQRGDYEFIGDTVNSKKWTYPEQKVEKEEQQIVGRLKQAFLKRASQAETLKTHIEKSPHPVILAGDFNDTPVSYCYHLFSTFLHDAFVQSGNGIGSTYIGIIPLLRIDYIFHSPNLHSYDYQTLPGVYSDHHAISCMIELP